MAETIRINHLSTTGSLPATAQPVRKDLCVCARLQRNCEQLRGSKRNLILGSGPQADFLLDGTLAEHLLFRFNYEAEGWDVRNVSGKPATLIPAMNEKYSFALSGEKWSPIERGDLLRLPNGDEITFDLVPPAGHPMPERVMLLGAERNRPGERVAAQLRIGDYLHQGDDFALIDRRPIVIWGEPFELYGIFDGISGGLPGGDGRKASEDAANYFAEYFQQNTLRLNSAAADLSKQSPLAKRDAMRELVEEAFEYVAQVLNSQGYNCGTTAVIVLRSLTQGKLSYCASVGDSRVYQLKPDGACLQLTEDDTIANVIKREYRKKNGKEYPNPINNFALAKHLGGGATTPDYYLPYNFIEVKLQDIAYLILVTDGVIDLAKLDREGRRGLAAQEPRAAANYLVGYNISKTPDSFDDAAALVVEGGARPCSETKSRAVAKEPAFKPIVCSCFTTRNGVDYINANNPERLDYGVNIPGQNEGAREVIAIRRDEATEEFLAEMTRAMVPNNSLVRTFWQKITGLFGGEPAKAIVSPQKRLFALVHEYFNEEWDDTETGWQSFWRRAEESFKGEKYSLGNFLQAHSGCGRHQAAALQLAYQELGYNSRFKRGQVSGRRLAWVEVEIDGLWFIADPQSGFFLRRDRASNLYIEGENIVELPAKGTILPR
ncbi:MAG: protein phosphatase 2C domain-containing protein [Candidatus Margulisiibacteriota bacterium]|jgi:serine/threonine protein phosphatase PrpC